MVAAERIEETGWAAELCDASWRLVWVSTQLRALLGNPSDAELGLGRHMLASRREPAWGRVTSPEVARRWSRENAPLMLEDTPGGAAALRELVEPDVGAALEGISASRAPAWTALLDFRESSLPVGQVRYFGVRARDSAGRAMGTIYLYGADLPATLLALVARGNPRLFERMARLVEPGRREAAILFADLQASGTLSRRLSSAAYFSLIRDLTTAMDEAIIDGGGIVGKHAGDGMTGFFLVGDLPSPSAAARASVSTARRIARAAVETAAAHGDLDATAMRINMGVHWGGTLYMGQVVTGGRLEVTALGDEVNEAARIQQAARGGTILASKNLIERLGEEDAAALGVDPPRRPTARWPTWRATRRRSCATPGRWRSRPSPRRNPEPRGQTTGAAACAVAPEPHPHPTSRRPP